MIRLAGNDVVRGTRVTRMVFLERVVPTLIQSPDGEGRATYRSFRRFQTSGRIVPLPQ